MYFQPDFYKFSSDSTQLAQYCAKEFKDRSHINILDLCSGCGIVGIEFALWHNQVKKLCFVEAQQEFKSYLSKNINNLIPKIEHEILIEDIKKFQFPQKFDLVISNPPYFLAGTGKESADPRKNQCHFYEEQMMNCLFVVAKNSLSENGRFYFLGRPDQKMIQDYLKNEIIVEVKNLGKSSIFLLNHSLT